MSNSLFRKKGINEDAGKQSDTMLSMILLNESSLPDIAQIKKYLISRFHENIKLDNITRKDTVIMFDLNGEKVFYALMPAPVPWNQLEGPCATAWYWPQAAELVSKHKAHIIAGILPDTESNLNSIDKAILLSKITAAILYNTDSIGVYWGSGTVINSKEAFIERVNGISRGNLPFELWIDLRFQRTKQGSFQFFTTGMKALGHMEIEMKDSNMDGNTILSFMYNVIAYLLQNGPVIKDGDTIRKDENQRITVRYGKSMWDIKQDVMIVEC